MSRILPKLVTSLTHFCDAWIVGSAADPAVLEPRDYDVLVPFSYWAIAASYVDKDAVPNAFGGWKCNSEGVVVDVWPGDLGWLMQSPKAKWAWHVRSGIRLAKVFDNQLPEELQAKTRVKS